MTEPVASASAEGAVQSEQKDGGGRRSRLVIAFLILLLLLLCIIATVVDVFLSRTPQQRRFITRNLECLQCHTELIPDMAKASVHNPFLLKDCTTCHTRHGSEVVETKVAGVSETLRRATTILEWLPLRLAFKTDQGLASVVATDQGGQVTTASKRVKGATSYLTQPEAVLCWTCHGDLGAKKNDPYQHAPFANGYCTDCHDPHASDFGPLLKQDPRDLCKTCHPMGAELSRMQTHPPAASWFCTDCHDPHASAFKGILVRRQRDLCFECHPTVAPLSLKPVQHSPFQNDDCTGCHEPHGADTRPLLIQSQPSLCYRCHPGIQNDFLKTSHHPVGTVKLNCADCHDPHAADYEFLLTARDDSFCYTCHAAAIRPTYVNSAHEVLLCIRCHTPHGSAFTPLLRNGNPELCLECHPVYNEYYAHPAGRTFYDTHAKKPLTCTSTCHNPHGTGNLRMLNDPYRKDEICLRCHPGVGVTF